MVMTRKTLQTIGILLLGGGIASAGPDAKLDFNRDIRPILSGQCFKCHGPDKHKNDLRLDLRDSALAGGSVGRL